MIAVYTQSINKYAKGYHEQINLGRNIFSAISEMIDPNELNLILFQQPDIKKINEKYEKIYKLLCNLNGWEKK